MFASRYYDKLCRAYIPVVYRIIIIISARDIRTNRSNYDVPPYTVFVHTSCRLYPEIFATIVLRYALPSTLYELRNIT